VENPFRRPVPPGLKIIETMRREGGRIDRLTLHLARLERAAGLLGFPCDPDRIRRLLDPGGPPARLRLTLDATGEFAAETAELPPAAAAWTASIARNRVDSGDPWLRVKTTNRSPQDQARRAMAGDEAILLNERGEVTEGTYTNLFADLGAGLVTPPLSSGLLPGVLRQDMLAEGRVREQVLVPDDLMQARRLFAGNSLRGLIPLRLI
jgi:4-amino-4-deoxychorismate lyase